MNICVIPARGGSKRIPRKNIKMFNGKPIIAYSIEAAIASGCFDKVIVSTDDGEIAEIARNFGVEVPFIRPAELSNDYAGTIPVIKHAIEWLEESNHFIENVCCLYATAPFIDPNSISSAYKKFKEMKADFCYSVTSFPFPIQRSIKISKNGKVELFQPEYFHYRSQDLEEAYHDAGQFYWGTKQAFNSENSILSDVVIPYILPRYLVQDIDTFEDWKRAEVMFKSLSEMGEL